MARFNPIQPATNVLPAAPGPEPETPKTPAEIRVAIGTRVHSGLYGGRDGIIYAIHGEQNPQTVTLLGGCVLTGGTATFDIVFTGHPPECSPGLPESILCGSGQWQIRPGLASAEEITAALAAAHAHQLAAEAEQARQQTARAEERARLKKAYPWLKPVDQGRNATGSQNLKTELNRAWPGVKFSVRSDGSALRVTWEFGPTVPQVQAISRKYQRGHFDGMTDSYEYDHDNVWPAVFGGARFVSESRELAMDYTPIGQRLCELQHIEYQGNDTPNLFGPGDNFPLNHHIRTLLDQTEFPRVNAKIKTIEPSDSSEPFVNFRILFDEPTAPNPTPQTPDPGVAAVATLTPSTHTKHGHPIWVIQLGTRVERPDFIKARELAHRLHGYYSSYRGGGAIPGFTFKDQAKATEFLTAVTALLSGTGFQPVTPSEPPTSAPGEPAPLAGPPSLAPQAPRLAIPAWRRRTVPNCVTPA